MTEQLSRPLSAFDAQFLAAETGRMTSNYCALAVFGPHARTGEPLTLARVRALVAARKHLAPALSWRLERAALNLDHPRFSSVEVDVDAHVVGEVLDEPGDDAALRAAAASLLGQRMDRSRPLWSLHVIEGLPDARTGVVMRFHHAAADGLAFATILAQLLDAEPLDDDPEAAEIAPRAAPEDGPSVMSAVGRAITHPLRAARSSRNALPHLDQVPMLRSLPGAPTLAKVSRRLTGAVAADHLDAPPTRFNARVSGDRVVGWATVDLDDVRAARQAGAVSFNDVVIAAVGGGLRRRLEATDGVPETPLLAYIPVNVRTEGQDGTVGNAISSFIVAVPTHSADPADRLGLAHQAMTAAKRRGESAPPTLLADANELIPPIAFAPLAAGVLRLLGTGLVAPPLNLIVSNVPGPPDTIYMAGSPMERVAPLSLIFDGATLNVTVVSYAGHLEIGIVADGTSTPDVQQLADEIADAFVELAALAPESAPA